MMLDGSPYQGYLYAYPHKTAYRPLRPRPALRDVWAGERGDALFLYVHVPFCEMRCGFCNLFTRAHPPQAQVAAYLRQLRHEADAVRGALDEAAGARGPGEPYRFALGAIGGGTPTYLTADELAALLSIVDSMGAKAASLSVETSPATATPERLAVLVDHGVHRVSIGVQSFLDTEAHAAGRPQRRSDVERALAAIREADVPALNIDLMYGIGGQTPSTWDASLRAALHWRPEEIYLYPLYVRPLTGLGRRAVTRTGSASDLDDPAWDEQRLSLYRQGRDTLRAAGYEQVSMRHFRRPSPVDLGLNVVDGDQPTTPSPRSTRSMTEYACQDDGMVGLGCGARSYTRDLHYSFDYAVSVRGVRAVLDDYLARPPGEFAFAEVGFRLDEVEQRRRWLVKGLLRAEGVSVGAWRERSGDPGLDGSAPGIDPPGLGELADRGWLVEEGDRIRLTDEGLAHSDAIGPWLVSAPVRAAMGEYHLK